MSVFIHVEDQFFDKTHEYDIKNSKGFTYTYSHSTQPLETANIKSQVGYRLNVAPAYVQFAPMY